MGDGKMRVGLLATSICIILLISAVAFVEFFMWSSDRETMKDQIKDFRACVMPVSLGGGSETIYNFTQPIADLGDIK